MCANRSPVAVRIPGPGRPEDLRVRAGQVRHGARWELRQCHGLDIPEGRDQVREGLSLPVASVIRSTNWWSSSSPVPRSVKQTCLAPPYLDHLAERVLVFPGKHVHVEGQRLHQGTEGCVPDEGSPAILDLDDLQGAEGPDGLPERALGNTQAVAQVGFAGQTVTGAKPVGRYELFDPFDGLRCPGHPCTRAALPASRPPHSISCPRPPEPARELGKTVTEPASSLRGTFPSSRFGPPGGQLQPAGCGRNRP